MSYVEDTDIVTIRLSFDDLTTISQLLLLVGDLDKTKPIRVVFPAGWIRIDTLCIMGLCRDLASLRTRGYCFWLVMERRDG